MILPSSSSLTTAKQLLLSDARPVAVVRIKHDGSRDDCAHLLGHLAHCSRSLGITVDTQFNFLVILSIGRSREVARSPPLCEQLQTLT